MKRSGSWLSGVMWRGTAPGRVGLPRRTLLGATLLGATLLGATLLGAALAGCGGDDPTPGQGESGDMASDGGAVADRGADAGAQPDHGSRPDGGPPDGGLPDSAPAPDGSGRDGGGRDGGGPDAAPMLDPAIDAAPLVAALEAALADAPDGFEGFTLLVFDADDTRVVEVSVGASAPDMRLPVASASKMASALVFLRLVEEGALRLDSTPGEVLGWQGPFADVTLDMLNGFTSGMPGNVVCTAQVRRTLAECAASMAGLDPIGAPGAVYDYGSTHQHVAAAMAEAATGQSWDALFRRTLAAPLGIDRPELRYVTLPRQALGEINPLIAGGLLASADEYARILSVVFHRGRIDGSQHIAEALVDRMGRNLYTEAEVQGSPARDNGFDYYYGFGSWLECAGPVASCPVVSSPGAFGFTPWVDWEAGYYAILATDRGRAGGSSHAMQVADGIKPMLRRAFEGR